MSENIDQRPVLEQNETSKNPIDPTHPIIPPTLAEVRKALREGQKMAADYVAAARKKAPPSDP